MKRLLVSLAIFAQACVSGDTIEAALGPSELKANAIHYDGQSVGVLGYVLAQRLVWICASSSKML